MRYCKLHAEGGPATPDLNDCCHYWIAGLREDLRINMMMQNPLTLLEVSTRANQWERVINAVDHNKVKQEQGKCPKPEEKNQSADTVSAEHLADKAAGVGHARKAS